MEMGLLLHPNVELVKFGLEQLLVRKLCLLLEDDACGSCGKIYMRGGINFRGGE